MSSKYKATLPGETYFITITVIEWIDLFTRLNQKQLIVDSLSYCQKEKGLEIYAWCLMHSHLHMICRAPDDHLLSDIMRDFKKFTSKKIVETIQTEPESRREWLLKMFTQAPAHLKRKQTYKVWQDGYHAVLLTNSYFIFQKLNYIHKNPVKEGFVVNPEDYLYSSAKNYAGLDAVLDVIVWQPQVSNT